MKPPRITVVMEGELPESASYNEDALYLLIVGHEYCKFPLEVLFKICDWFLPEDELLNLDDACSIFGPMVKRKWPETMKRLDVQSWCAQLEQDMRTT